jgi:hypothetical protein
VALTPLEVVQKLHGSKAEKEKATIFVTSSYEVHAARFEKHMRAMDALLFYPGNCTCILPMVTKSTTNIYQK